MVLSDNPAPVSSCVPPHDPKQRPANPCTRTASYLQPYRAAVDRIGPRFEALLWTSPETQLVRFRAITQMFDFRDHAILDAGCGRGDLARWLCREQVNYRRYLGVDAVPEMLQFAREQGLPNSEFQLLDFVADEHAFCAAAEGGAPDVVVFSGSLNTLPQEMALAVVDRAWAACRVAVVFNFLSIFDGEDGEGPARKFSPVDVVRWALERTVLVAFRHDYLEGRDGTVVMRKSV